MDAGRSPGWFVLAGALLLGGGAAAQTPSGRHGDGHDRHHDWYQDLRQPDTGWSCCDGGTAEKPGDCRPTKAFRGEDGRYRAWDGHDWLVVPNAKVLRLPTPDRGPHLCEMGGLVFCFITGEPTS